MPLMTKIRESLSTFFSIFAGLFVIYIVLDWGMDITGRRHQRQQAEAQQIGKINGVPVTYREFEEVVKQAVDSQKAQTGQDPDDNQVNNIRDEVWNQMVDQHLYDEAAKKLNVKVTDQEIVDWVRGDDPPEFLKRQFTDSTGTFKRAQYDATIMDPRNKTIMVSIEEFLRRQRMKEKLESLILSTLHVSEQDILNRFTDQTVKYSADYALFDPNQILKDSVPKVSDEELRKYYNDNSEEFKVEASRKLKYVVFHEQASRSDSEEISNEMLDIRKRAEAGTDFLDLQKTYSETPVPDRFFKHGEINPDIESALYSVKEGAISGPILTPDGYHLVKALAFQKGTDEAIHARHILIRIENNDSVQALTKAKEIAQRARSGEDFAALARQYSADGSAMKGGDLGWFTKGRMVKPFEDAAFKAKPGQIVGPVRSQFGYHIINVLARDNQEVKYADIHMSIHMSPQTKSDILQRAKDFAYLAKEGSFDREAEQSKYSVQETPAFQKGTYMAGLGINNAINKFAFSEKVGSVSDAFTIQNGDAVVMVTEARDAGLRPFDEVKSTIEARVRKEINARKLITMAGDLLQKLSPGDSLAKLAAGHPGVSAQHLDPFLPSTFIPGIGRDPGFVGALAALKPGETSKPFEGGRGIYVVRLLSKTPFDSTAYKAQRDVLRSQILTEMKNRFLTEWTDQLKKSAEIVDNRDQFYR